jgi:hypothetical protein
MEIKSMKKSLVPVQPESDAKLGAQLQIDGTLVALVTQDYLPLSASSPLDISDAVKEQAKSIHDGDLSQLESMLLQQAVDAEHSHSARSEKRNWQPAVHCCIG